MYIDFIKHIVKLGADADGLSAADRTKINRKWYKHIAPQRVKETIDIFNDLTVDRTEFQKLVKFATSPLYSYNPLTIIRVTKQLRDIVGRYGRRARVGHMQAILKKVQSSKNKTERIKLLKKIIKLNPTHETSLLKQLDNIVRDPTMNPRASYLAAQIWVKIHLGLKETGYTQYGYLSRLAKISPSLKRDNKFLLHCSSISPRCAKYIHAPLKSNSKFIRKLVGTDGRTLRYTAKHLYKMSLVDAIGIVEKAIEDKPATFRYAIPFLRSLPPIVSALITAKALEGAPEILPHTFPFLHKVNREYALQLAYKAAGKDKNAFTFLLKKVRGVPRKKLVKASIRLLGKDPTALQLVKSTISKVNSSAVKNALFWATLANTSAVPAVMASLTVKDREKFAFHYLKNTYKPCTEEFKLHFEVVPTLLPYILKWIKGSDEKKKELASKALDYCKSTPPHKLFLMPHTKAIRIVVKAVENHYREANVGRFVEGIPKKFRSDVRVQKVLFEKNFHEIGWLIKNNPRIVNPSIKRKYDRLVSEAQALGIVTLERFHSTAILRTIIKNRQNVDRNDGRPLAVALYGKFDFNGAFKWNDLEKISKHYRLIYFEVTDKNTWFKNFERATRKQWVSLLIAAGHGGRLYLNLTRKITFSTTDIRKLKRLNNRVAPNAQILVFACYAGAGLGKGDDMMTAFSDSFPQAFVHGQLGDSSSIYPTKFSSNGMVNRFDLGVKTLILHKYSDTNKIYHPHSNPYILTPQLGWGISKKPLSKLDYKEYLLSKGYKNGMLLFPEFKPEKKLPDDSTLKLKFKSYKLPQKSLQLRF